MSFVSDEARAHMVGSFEQIFPFNDNTEEAAETLDDMV